MPELSTERVLTTEWVDGLNWSTSSWPTEPPATKQRAAEVIWRFAQHSIHRLGVFNGDPHPGNYHFHHDGSVTFLDFGLVKRWDAGRVGAPRAGARRHRRVTATPTSSCRRWRRPDSSPPDHGLDPQRVYDYVS